MKEINYYVIGGQYAAYCHGGTKTLLGAKRLANKCAEHWDNAEDTREVSNFYGKMRAPREDALPVAWARYNDGRPIWECVQDGGMHND
jgi:hypothetical protein|nr:MAG TPA: hypothetical protein [Caudoviricetes sp.]